MLVSDLFSDAPLQLEQLISLDLLRLLKEPIDISKDWNRAEKILLQLKEKLPKRTEVKIALYKMYAYSNHFDKSMILIQEALQDTANDGGFSHDWRTLTSDSSSDWYPAKGSERMYLYSMKALGFVSMRKGDFDQAGAVLHKLKELDPRDQVGGSVVLDMYESLMDCMAELEDEA